MQPENDLKNNPCTVRLFVNDEEFTCEFFTDRQERIKWMDLKTKLYGGIKNVYFQLEYQYPELKESDGELISGYELKSLDKKKEPVLVFKKSPEFIKEKIIIEPERPMTEKEVKERRKKLTVYSNKQWT